MKTTIIQGYECRIFWHEEDQCFVADFPAFDCCSAFGDTEKEAIYEAEVAIRLSIEVCKEKGIPLPPVLPTINDLSLWTTLINKAALARLIGLKETTLKSKIRNKSQLSPDEAVAVVKALEQLHLAKI